MLHVEITNGARVHGKEASLDTWKHVRTVVELAYEERGVPVVRPATATIAEIFMLAC